LQREAIGENLPIRYGSRPTTRKSRSRKIAFFIVVCPVEMVRIGGITQAFVTDIAAYAVEIEIISCGGAGLGEFAGVEVEVYEEGVSGIEGARNVEF
jgi:hypothetical protein